MKRSSGPPFFFRFFSPEHLVCQIPVQEKKIFLTFDDGPVPEMTPQVLQILSEYGAKATFFMVGDNVKKHPEVCEQVVAGGHVAGNHTFHHLNGWKTAPAAYAEDVRRCDPLIHTRLFRPPYGRFTPSQYMILRKDYLFVMWSVLTWDFLHRVAPEECLENAIRNTKPGDIVVFHDSLKAASNMLFTLPRYLDHFRKKGYTFEVI
jgi:peptidoglycan/xylan/chitin deacetylase (PgdA/CDA1 family)